MTNPTPGLSYDLQVTLQPAGRRLAVAAVVHNPPEAGFYLNKDLTVDRLLVDGQPVDFQRDPARTLVSPGDTLVHWAGPAGRELRVEYSGVFQEGTLPKILEVVSAIREDLVELALYAAWYPRFKNGGGVSFGLSIDLPAGWQVTTNGRLEQGHPDRNMGGQERSCTRWVSLKPGFDIVILAAPHLQSLTAWRGAAQVEIVFDRLPPEYAQRMGEYLLAAMQRYSEWYGALPDPAARLIYAPRDAWGYARSPAIIVSEGSALERLDDPLGPVRDVRYAAHELAHFWWGAASMNTPDDWINEGLAEYSAYHISEELFGPGPAAQRATEYRQHAAGSKTDTPIAETAAGSPDREVNRYDKVALLLIATRQRFGAPALDRLLRALYARFGKTHDATTATFLDEVETQMGLEARRYLEQGLCTPWREWA